MRGSDGRPARVVSVGRNAAWIVFDDEDWARPASLPKRLQRLSLAPGDRVLAQAIDSDRAIVDERMKRSFALVRRVGSGRAKTMAANVDSIVIVAAFDRPTLNLPMVDELLAFAELHELRAVVIFTKPDLIEAVRSEELRALYGDLGYAVFSINPKRGEGVDAVAGALAARHSLLIGQSGVGKSTLYRALGGETTIGDVSRQGRGRQTTTSARLLRFGDGFLIDSPGVGEFALERLERQPEAEWCAEVAHGFVEFRPLLGKCRFSDCTHRSEPDCAVRSAVAAGTGALSRYESYLLIVAREGVAAAEP